MGKVKFLTKANARIGCDAANLRWFLTFLCDIKPQRAQQHGKYFLGNFSFFCDDKYQEERERSDSRYSRKRKTKIYQKDATSTELREQISYYLYNALFLSSR